MLEYPHNPCHLTSSWMVCRDRPLPLTKVSTRLSPHNLVSKTACNGDDWDHTTLTSNQPFMSRFIASQYPPPEKRFGGAEATATRQARIVARTFSGNPFNASLPGAAWLGSSSLCRWKNTMSCGSSEDVVNLTAGWDASDLVIPLRARRSANIKLMIAGTTNKLARDAGSIILHFVKEWDITMAWLIEQRKWDYRKRPLSVKAVTGVGFWPYPATVLFKVCGFLKPCACNVNEEKDES